MTETYFLLNLRLLVKTAAIAGIATKVAIPSGISLGSRTRFPFLERSVARWGHTSLESWKQRDQTKLHQSEFLFATWKGGWEWSEKAWEDRVAPRPPCQSLCQANNRANRGEGKGAGWRLADITVRTTLRHTSRCHRLHHGNVDHFTSWLGGVKPGQVKKCRLLR